jgi:hypothetical protein
MFICIDRILALAAGRERAVPARAVALPGHKKHHLCTLVAENAPRRKCHGKVHGQYDPCNCIIGRSEFKTFITFFTLYLIACRHQTSRLKTLIEFFALHLTYLRLSDIVTQNVYHVFLASSDPFHGIQCQVSMKKNFANNYHMADHTIGKYGLVPERL